MQLPDTLRAAIEDLMSGRSTQELARHYQAISERYRREISAPSLQITNKEEALAYTASRLPATYGAVLQACRQARLSLPDFSPASLLDIGSGPGTAALAALYSWPDSLRDACLLEPNPHLREISHHLISTTGTATKHDDRTLSSASFTQSHDLVMSSYVLNEIRNLDLDQEIEKLWNATGQTLILIEPGTPLGFSIILQARSKLIELGTQLAAPCPHHLACPLAQQERWCHMSARIERSTLHKKVKCDSTLGYEDEKFSYLVASRTPAQRPSARLLGHPHGPKVMDLELCRADGRFMTETVSKRDPRYKAARKASWGDRL